MTAQEVDGGIHLINVFSVPKGKEDDFVKWWEDVKATITVQQGVVSGKSYRSINPESRFNFINVAVWEKEEVYWKPMRRARSTLIVPKM